MKDLEFLKEITVVPGGSGDEGKVREILKREINKVTEAKTDAFGDIYGVVGKGPKVMAFGHMDEIGFMVRAITNDGMIKVGMVGFVFPYGMEMQEYTIVTSTGKMIDGIMGRNPEQGKGGDMSKILSVEEEMIDIGCTSKKEVEDLGIEVGNAVIYKAHFLELQNHQLVSKAWDNRIGCAICVRAMQEAKNLKVTYIAGGSAQEEVGCRGARALGVSLSPDIAFAIDTAPSADEDGSRIGSGPQIFVMDSCTIANKKLLEFVKKTAKDNNIPYQLCFLRHGGSDASEFQNISGGCPSITIGVAVKNIHGPKGIISYDDYENTLKLLKCCLEALDEDKVNEIKSF